MANVTDNLSILQLLIAVAKSDRKIEETERTEIEEAIQGKPLPQGYTIERLLTEEVPLETTLSNISSAEVRKSAFEAAYLLAHADGTFSESEKQFLEKVRQAWDIPQGFLVELEHEAKILESGEASATVTTAASAEERAKQIKNIANKYCILTALAGAVPVPLIGDLTVIPMQTKFVYDIGKTYGQDVNSHMAKSILAALGIGTGARIAVSSLSKLIPGWGSFVGASAAYASTYALGKAATKYFEGGAKIPAENLKSVYKEALVEGKQQYEASKPLLDQKRQEQSQIERLGVELKGGRITQAEYDCQISDLLAKV